MTDQLPKFLPINILLVSYNRLNLLKKSLESIVSRTRYPYKIFVVDNNSNDGSVDYLKHMKITGVIFDHLFLPVNEGQATALSKAFNWMQEWEIRRSSDDLFLTTQDDIVCPLFKDGFCWLEYQKHLFEKYEKELNVGAIAHRIERTSRIDIDEEKELIPLYKTCPSVFRMIRRSDFSKLGDKPFSNLKHWESNGFQTILTTMIKKRSFMATHIYSSHIGYALENKGFPEDDKSFFTYSGPEKMELYKEKPYSDIEENTNIPINYNHGCDFPEHEKRLKYWGQYCDYDISSIKPEDLQREEKVFNPVRTIEHEELRKHITGERVLDLGCANKKIIDEATGVDVYPFPCVDVIARADDLWWIKDNEIDTIVSCHLLEHMPDTKKIIQEWNRVIKIGGVLAFVVPDGENSKTILDPAHKVALTKEVIRRIVKQVLGNEVIRLENINTNKPSIICVSKKIK